MTDNPGPMPLLRDPLWKRQFGESHQAFAAFEVYRDLGAPRTVVEAYRQKLGKPDAKYANGTWNRWAQHWHWPQRAAAWDDHLDEVTRQAQENAARAEGEQLAELRRSQRQRELDVGSKLLQRAEEMLALPVIEVSIDKDDATGKVTQVFKPGKWRMGDVARIVEVAVQLRRLGLDMDTSRTTVRVDVEQEVRQMARQYGWDEAAAIEAARKFALERGA